MKILLADDDKMMTTMLKFKFEREKLDITIVTDGLEAKESLNKIVPDIIITDIMMPYISGLELVNYVREDLKLEIPIIVLSSAGQEKTVLKAFEMGANDYMTKPFSPNELIVRVKKTLAVTKSNL